MRRRHAVLSAVLIVLIAGCSILRKEHRQGIAGTWTGKGIVTGGGITQEWNMTLQLNEDSTMSLTYERKDRKTITLRGNYTADISTHPAQIEIFNYGFPKGTTYCGMAIVEFPNNKSMNMSCIFGTCGEITRPSGFIRIPEHNRQLYLELTRK